MRSTLARERREHEKWEKEMQRELRRDAEPCSPYQMRRARTEMTCEAIASSGDCSIDEALRWLVPICQEAVSNLPASALLHLSEQHYCNALAYQMVAAGYDKAEREYAIPVVNQAGLPCGMLFADLVLTNNSITTGERIIIEVKKFLRDREAAERQVLTYAEFYRREYGPAATAVVIIEEIVAELGLDRTGWELESHFAAMLADAPEGE